MRFNSKIIFIISLAAGFAAFSMTIKTFDQLKKGPKTLQVVTAMEDMSVATVVNASTLKLVIAPKGIDTGIVYTEIDKVAGQMLRNPVRRGQPITKFDLLDKNDNLATLIPEGYRAASITLSLSRETLNFLKFGNRVDVLLTTQDSGGKTTETKTIIKNILVMNTVQKANTPSAADKTQATVTLAVRPEGSEILAYAANRGKIDLVVRPMTDKNVSEEYINFDELRGINKNNFIPVLEKTDVEVIRGVKKDLVKV